MPGIKDGCSPVRWWTARVILATCTHTGLPGGNMWLVPAGGGTPKVLTPPRRKVTFDAGDFNAWQLSSGLYVDGVGACGTLVIGRQPAHGPEQMVHVPGAPSSLIITATRTRLLVERFNSCNPGASLVWLNPATHKMSVAVPVGAGSGESRAWCRSSSPASSDLNRGAAEQGPAAPGSAATAPRTNQVRLMTMKIATGLRGRRAICAAAVTAAAATLGLAVPAVAAPGSAVSASVLGAGRTGALASVPWSRVGPGWTLAMFSRNSGGEGAAVKYGATTLYLVDPNGGRYSLRTWPARNVAWQWQLLAWSGDTRRALFTSLGASDQVQVHQLQLRTGRVSTFSMPADMTVLGYTRPDGLNILMSKWQSAGRGTLQRYSLTGRLQKSLAKVDSAAAVAYQPAGGSSRPA